MSGPAAVTAVTVCVAGKLMVSRKQLDNDNNYFYGGKRVSSAELSTFIIFPHSLQQCYTRSAGEALP